MSRLTRRAEADGVKAVWYGNREVFLEGEPGYAEADKLAHYEDLEEQGILIDRKALETALSTTMRALTIIGEICVEESKMHIDKKMAVREIRECLRKHNPVSSRYELELLLDNLAEAKLAELQSFPTLPILHGNVAPASREEAMERLGLRDKLAELKGGEQDA